MEDSFVEKAKHVLENNFQLGGFVSKSNSITLN